LLDRFAHRGRHREHARIAARYDRDPRALRRVCERRCGARQLLAIVGRMAGLASARRHAIEVGSITIKRLRGIERSARVGGEPIGVARAEPNHGEMPAHGRVSQPGTRTTAKYGALSSRFWASGIATPSAMVPRST